MANVDIRAILLSYGIKQYQLADKLKMHASALSLKLRKELSEKDKKKILKAIEELRKGA